MTASLSKDESRDLARSVRAMCDRLISEERVRAVAFGEGSHRGFDEQLWRALCTQVGVVAMALPEEQGGAGYGATALGVVAHKLGRALAPVPFVASVLATDLVAHQPRIGRRAVGRGGRREIQCRGGNLRRRRRVASRCRHVDRAQAAHELAH